MKYTANTQRVFSFIFCAVRNFIIKWTKLILTIINSAFRKISRQVAKHFSKRMFWYFHQILRDRPQPSG